MKQIKETLIHWLGGRTFEEDRFNSKTFYILGKRLSVKEIKEYADSLYGLSADEWCNKMYEYLTEKENEDEPSRIEGDC